MVRLRFIARMLALLVELFKINVLDSRLLADLFGLVGALSIKLIVDGMAEQLLTKEESSSSNNNNNSSSNSSAMDPSSSSSFSYRALTLEEFFTDSYVVAFGVLLAALGQARLLLHYKPNQYRYRLSHTSNFSDGVGIWVAVRIILFTISF